MLYILKNHQESLALESQAASENITSISTFVVLTPHSSLLLTDLSAASPANPLRWIKKLNPNNYQQNQTKTPKPLEKPKPKTASKNRLIKKPQYKANPFLAMPWTKTDYGRFFTSNVR